MKKVGKHVVEGFVLQTSPKRNSVLIKRKSAFGCGFGKRVLSFSKLTKGFEGKHVRITIEEIREGKGK